MESLGVAAGEGAAGPHALNDLAGQNTEEFFRGMTSAMTSAVSQHFERRLKAETDAIRQAYDDALQRERIYFQSQLQTLSQSLGDPSPNEEAETFRDVAQLHNELTRYLQGEADASKNSPYSPAIATMLQELLYSAQTLNDHCQDRLSKMITTFCPKGLNGKEYPVEVRPTKDTVKEAKEKIRAFYCKTCEVKLCMSDGHMEMDDSKLLMQYNLDQEFAVILVDVLRSNELVHLSFEDGKNLAFDSVTGRVGTVSNPEHVEASNIHGKMCVNITENGCLVLPKPVELTDVGWTISSWILSPMNPHSPRNRHLIDGNHAHDRVCVALSRGKLKNLDQGNCLRGFNVTALSDGWHHLVVVGKTGVTSYYMDGKLLGQKSGMAKGPIATVGNSPGCRFGWGYLADFHIFGMAADLLQIEGLYDAGGGVQRDLATDPWQDDIVQQNLELESESVSSYSSLQSYMDSDFSG